MKKEVLTETDKKYVLCAEMANKLWSMRFKDEFGIDNYFLDIFFQEYMKIHVPTMITWFDTIWAKQKTKKESYGDIDWGMIKVYEGNNDGKEVKILYYSDYVSCAPHTDFLIFKETSVLLNQEIVHFHIRKVWKRGDYRKSNDYVNCPNLKWYKDRGYTLSYIDKLHMGPLGGSYGDCRDNGYVLTAKKDFYRDGFEVEKGAMSNYWMIKMVASMLGATANELNQ